MDEKRSLVFAAITLLALQSCAFAQDNPVAPDEASPTTDQTLYKGPIGNMLDKVSMDPETRASLQRANSVVSNATTGRSLGVFAGMGGPLLMLGGLVWGLWAASHITSAVASPPPAPAESDTKIAIPTAVAAARALTEMTADFNERPWATAE